MAAKNRRLAFEPALSFALRYEWVEGAVPPPYHYEWTIELQNRQGIISFYPDYPQQGVSPWVKNFQVPGGQFNYLVETLHTSRVFRTHWQQPEEVSAGGAHDSLTVWLEGQTYQVPPIRTPGANRAMQPVWQAVKACVPKPVWDELFQKREEILKASAE
jgi:hypothetical protein